MNSFINSHDSLRQKYSTPLAFGDEKETQTRNYLSKIPELIRKRHKVWIQNLVLEVALYLTSVARLAPFPVRAPHSWLTRSLCHSCDFLIWPHTWRPCVSSDSSQDCAHAVLNCISLVTENAIHLLVQKNQVNPYRSAKVDNTLGRGVPAPMQFAI